MVESTTIEDRKASFTKATAQYFSLLSSIDVRLRRQIHALKEAGILPADGTSRDGRASLAFNAQLAAMGNARNAKHIGRGDVTGGGLGNLNVGWLNSRNDSVGKEMEAELWEEAQRFVERLEGSHNIEGQDVHMLKKNSSVYQD